MRSEIQVNSADSERKAYEREFNRRTLMDELARIFGHDLAEIYSVAEILGIVAVVLTLLVEWSGDELLHLNPTVGIMFGFTTGILVASFSLLHGARRQLKIQLDYSGNMMVLVGYQYFRDGRRLTREDILHGVQFRNSRFILPYPFSGL